MRIVLADPNQKTLWAFKISLDEESGMEVIGEAANAQQLQDVADGSHADLVLLDRRLPGDDIVSLITWLHALDPRPVVIVMSSDTEDSRIMLRAGADAFLSKGERPDWLLNVLRHYARTTPSSSDEGHK